MKIMKIMTIIMGLLSAGIITLRIVKKPTGVQKLVCEIAVVVSLTGFFNFIISQLDYISCRYPVYIQCIFFAVLAIIYNLRFKDAIKYSIMLLLIAAFVLLSSIYASMNKKSSEESSNGLQITEIVDTYRNYTLGQYKSEYACDEIVPYHGNTYWLPIDDTDARYLIFISDALTDSSCPSTLVCPLSDLFTGIPVEGISYEEFEESLNQQGYTIRCSEQYESNTIYYPGYHYQQWIIQGNKQFFNLQLTNTPFIGDYIETPANDYLYPSTTIWIEISGTTTI